MLTLRISAQVWLGLGLAALLVACGGGSAKPTVTLSAPATTLEDGQTLTLKADAKNTNKVEFYKDAQKIGEDGSAPFEYNYTISTNEDATFSFTAKAIAADNQFGISEPVSVQVKVDKIVPQVGLTASNSNLNAIGSVTLTAYASDNKGVVKVEFFKGANKLGEDTTPADGFKFVVSVNAEDNGALKYTAKAYDAKGNVGVSEELAVNVDIDVTAPAVSLSSDKSNLNAPGTITLTASASDDKGVVKVEFYKEANKLGEDTTSADGFKFVVNLTSEDNGVLKYTAKAYDAKGNVGTSAEITVGVDIDVIDPSVNLFSEKTLLTESGNVVLTASAQDNKGVARVEFYNSDQKVGEDTEAPFTHTLNFTAAHNGLHTYTAKAFDAAGNSATSDMVNITVNIDATKPAVSVVSDKTTFTLAGDATLTATASDDKGVVKVEFYEGNTKLAEDAEAPYTHALSFTSENNGTHTYTAKAFDAQGNSATSAEVSITVDVDITKPVVNLAADKLSLSASGNITLIANATDNKGVTRVEFYQGLTKLSEDSEAPYFHTLSLFAVHDRNGQQGAGYSQTYPTARSSRDSTTALPVIEKTKESYIYCPLADQPASPVL